MSGAATWHQRSEAQNEYECFVDRAQLIRIEAPGRAAEAFGVDDSRLLDEHARFLSFQPDRGSEACRSRACRGGGDEDGREVEELVRLHDHGVARPALLVSSRFPRGWEPEDLPTDHLSRGAERAPPSVP